MTATVMPKTDSSSTFKPRQVGRYLLHREIAHGGMATVHIGRLLGQVGFSRTVAIKRMHEHCARDPDFVSMFIDEARLAARIRHPNVVPTLDVVALDAELFLVMEYVQGETLARLIRRASKSNLSIAPRIASSVIAGVLEGLHAAHEAVGDHGEPLGIVHRDVSPQNVIVGHDGIARVLDFGVAKAANRLQTTRDGQIKGKVEYMAPEQLRGSLVDRRTDVYAAACCLWEMLTGQRLYQADNQVLLWGKVMEGKVDPPSALRPDVPRALDEITMRGLHADPTKRFQSAEDMAIAFEQQMGIATPREVGRWVQTLAGKKLREHAEIVAELDSVASDVSSGTDSRDPKSVVSGISSKRSAPVPKPPEQVAADAARDAPEKTPFKAPRPSVPASPVVPPPPESILASSPTAESQSPHDGDVKKEAAPEASEPVLAPPPVIPDPAPEVDIEPPFVEPAALVTGSSFADASAPQPTPDLAEPIDELIAPRSKPVGLIVAAIAGGLAAIVFAVVWTRSRQEPTAPSPSTVVSAAKPEPELVVAAGAPPSAVPEPAAKVTLHIVVAPSTATIELDGAPTDAREIALPRSSSPVKVVARAPGYETMERTFVPEADGRISFELRLKVPSKPAVTIKGPLETEL